MMSRDSNEVNNTMRVLTHCHTLIHARHTACDTNGDKPNPFVMNNRYKRSQRSIDKKGKTKTILYAPTLYAVEIRRRRGPSRGEGAKKERGGRSHGWKERWVDERGRGVGIEREGSLFVVYEEVAE